MGDTLFENESYLVEVGSYLDTRGVERFGYCVTNKDTTITEYTTQYLPDAINTAKGLMDAMDRVNDDDMDIAEEIQVPEGVASH